MYKIRKLVILVGLLVFILSACSKNELTPYYNDMRNILNSYESGFNSTIKVGEDSYFLEQDISGNSHVIQYTGDERIELYNITNKYYICNDKCYVMNKDIVEQIYGDKYSVSVLQTVLDSAFEYHEQQYAYILGLEEKDIYYELAVDNQGVATIMYPTTEEERQLIIVDSKNGTIKYNYDGEEENDVNFSLTPDLVIEVNVEEGE